MSLLSASKRRFLKEAGLIALFTPAIMSRPAFAEETKGIVEKLKDKVTGKGEEKEVTPPEDLMREHGVLDRVLLVYEACMRKFASKEDFDPALLTQSATIIRDFIHDYHEQSEEHYIFPRFRQANQLTELVGTLLDQHHAGRRVTEQILQLAPNIRTDADAQRRVTVHADLRRNTDGLTRPQARGVYRGMFAGPTMQTRSIRSVVILIPA
jgi:hypothetical protein